MDKGRVVSVLANPLLMQSERLRELAKQFRWKAENNIRFYEKLNMTTEEKVEFLSQEFSGVYWLGEMRRLDWPDVSTESKPRAPQPAPKER